MDYYKLDSNVKIYSIISYIGPLFILARLSKMRCNKIVDFHSWQGGILFFTVSFLNLALMWMTNILSVFPIFSEIISLLLGIGVFTFSLVLSIMGIVNASKLDISPLPFIGRIDMIMRNHYKYM